MVKEITRCVRCIMDNASDEYIVFDSSGYCNYCTAALERKQKTYFPNKEGEVRLDKLLTQIKQEGKGKKYDCLMGISGGLDSSYLAYLGAKWGLRIIAVHVDDGFDTDISKKNIRKLIDKTGIDFIEIKPDNVQYNALTKAYMKAGVPNLAVPQDNILFAALYSYAKKNSIKYFLSGYNFALESILQKGNTYVPYDVVNIKDINKRFGEQKIDRLHFISQWQIEIDKRLLGLRTIIPLDLIDYNRDRAFKELHDFCGFEYYGRKHLENILTAFIQLYWFPKKFAVDKRTSHLSSMIISGQMTREEAMAELAKPLYEEDMMNKYLAVIKGKLYISDKEFEEIMKSKPHAHTDYKTSILFGTFHKIYRKIRGV